jgi:hypothetical protein
VLLLLVLGGECERAPSRSRVADARSWTREFRWVETKNPASLSGFPGANFEPMDSAEFRRFHSFRTTTAMYTLPAGVSIAPVKTRLSFVVDAINGSANRSGWFLVTQNARRLLAPGRESLPIVVSIPCWVTLVKFGESVKVFPIPKTLIE